jgi:hypothetical protein
MTNTADNSANKKSSISKKSTPSSDLAELENNTTEEKRLKLALHLRKF